MEELTAEGLYKSLSTISLDSLNSKLDQKNRLTPNPKESYILELNDTQNEADISKKDSKDINTSSQANNTNVLERLEEYKAIKKEYKSFIFEVSMDIIDAIWLALDDDVFSFVVDAADFMKGTDDSSSSLNVSINARASLII